jgi:moderate conductance mechanosensitive channel
VTLTLLALAESAPSPTAEPSPPACQDNQLCDFIYDQTGNQWLAAGGYYLLVKPARILLIVLLALLIRHITIRMINRLASRASDGKAPSLFRPLRDRMPAAPREPTGLRLERRRQRAEALASVLRSVASISIFTITAMLVLAELGVNLAPLIASAGIVGVAFGFGAQNLVKDFISGLFMLLEDQYGVGDLIDVGEVSGTVEAVGLRITTVRDSDGMLWYLRNGEISRVGNKSQGWALVEVETKVPYAAVEETSAKLRAAAKAVAEDPEYAADFLNEPEVLADITPDGAVIRTSVRTHPESQARAGRELRRRLAEANEADGAGAAALAIGAGAAAAAAAERENAAGAGAAALASGEAGLGSRPDRPDNGPDPTG